MPLSREGLGNGLVAPMGVGVRADGACEPAYGPLSGSAQRLGGADGA